MFNKLKTMIMKKLFMTISVLAFTTMASAQQIYEGSKFSDNWFVSFGAGGYVPTVGANFFPDMRPAMKLELGRYFTPAVGISASVQAGINDNNGNSRSNIFVNGRGGKNVFDFTNVSLNGLLNLNNFFSGYNGYPRPFEIVAEAGLGWGHFYGMRHGDKPMQDRNFLTAAFGLGMNLNVSDALQINFKPGITYSLSDMRANKFNVNSSYLTLMAGITYKFMNSNGSHNFKLSDRVYTQAEMDDMNDKINRMRVRYEEDIDERDAEIMTLEAQLAEALTDEITTDAIVVEKDSPVPVVLFAQGSSEVMKSQEISINMIADYMKTNPDCNVLIKGYASTEGTSEFNQKLSEDRAKAVYDILVKKYGISASRLTAKGFGETDGLFSELEWNRVCIFVDAK